jgi:hypothetical protein
MAGRTSSELSKMVSSFQAPNSCGKIFNKVMKSIASLEVHQNNCGILFK